MKEKDLEKKCKALAKSYGWWVRKFVSPANRGEPDDLFLKAGRYVFIEFKREGETPTDFQWKKMLDIRDHGGEAYWCSDETTFRFLLGIGVSLVLANIVERTKYLQSLCPDKVLKRIGRT